eukprot:4542389-Amphidinium_carterae.1
MILANKVAKQQHCQQEQPKVLLFATPCVLKHRTATPPLVALQICKPRCEHSPPKPPPPKNQTLEESQVDWLQPQWGGMGVKSRLAPATTSQASMESVISIA